MTLHLKLTGGREDDALLDRAAMILRDGGLVAFPTETVYGLGANALDVAAVQKIFEAKERPSWDPIIVHVTSREMLAQVAGKLPPRFEQLASRFMPGPLTILLPRSGTVPDVVTAGRATVAVRFPAHPVARALIERAGVPVAAPSANRFGRPSPTTAEHVLADLAGRFDAVLDAGPSPIGVESTVLDLAAEPPLILRAGGVTREQLESVLGIVRVFDTPIEPLATESLASPGLGIRHYAPSARMVLVEGEAGALAAAVSSELQAGRKAGVMLPQGWSVPQAAVVFDWGPWQEFGVLAKRLFAGLRWLDEQKVDVIVAPLPPEEGLGLALRDRLQKAAR